ncbi:MAG: nicotinate-nucleotide--dimethylbenzimidazole phosphoribosyltransferase, partial [Mesorhizobium sp.]
ALAAAVALNAVDAAAVEHCLLASADYPAMRQAGLRIGLSPLIEAGVAAGEGTAAVLSSSIVKDALALHAGIAAHGASSAHKH